MILKTKYIFEFQNVYSETHFCFGFDRLIDIHNYLKWINRDCFFVSRYVIFNRSDMRPLEYGSLSFDNVGSLFYSHKMFDLKGFVAYERV